MRECECATATVFSGPTDDYQCVSRTTETYLASDYAASMMRMANLLENGREVPPSVKGPTIILWEFIVSPMFVCILIALVCLVWVLTLLIR